MESVTTVSTATRCTETIDVLTARLETVLRNKQTMIEGAARACDDYPGEIARVHTALDERKRQIVLAGTDANRTKGKTMEVKVDSLVVTSSQLRICAAMCQRACPEGTLEYVQKIIDAASQLLLDEVSVVKVETVQVAMSD